MKLIRRHLMIAALFMLINGCRTTFSPMNLEKIDVGMSKVEVLEILGEPYASTIDNENIETFHYAYEDNGINNILLEGNHTRMDSLLDSRDEIISKMMQTQKYEVKLKDGCVISQQKVE